MSSIESRRVVQRLWHFCNVLRDDGLSYPDYCEQLTYLLFLKMAQEQRDDGAKTLIPEAYDWDSLLSKRGRSLANHYSAALVALGRRPGLLGTIFNGAKNKIKDPAKLRLLIVDLVNKERWTGLDIDVKGEAYEGLLEKNAQDAKSGAGQYFTPRALVRAVVSVIDPKPGETISDPACGTCGFLLAAHEHILKSHPEMTARERRRLRESSFLGTELVDAVARLGAMNLLLHGIGSPTQTENQPIVVGDSLRAKPTRRFDVIVTNPPFGKKSSITLAADMDDEDRQDLTVDRSDFWVETSNKQLNFVQHVYNLLKPGGRAALVVPDNVLFEGGAGEVIRRKLLETCRVHTLLRLPSGIFYAQGVKANVLFLDRRARTAATDERKLWIYDLRSRNRMTLKTRPLSTEDLDDFVKCYRGGDGGMRTETRTPDDSSPNRWRGFTYDELKSREKCSWDILWLRDDNLLPGKDLDPAKIGETMRATLQVALAGIQRATEGLDGV